MKRLGLTIVTAFTALAFLLSGCSAGVINKGGDTTCKEYNGLEDDKQRDAVEKMIQDRKSEEGSNLEVSAVQVSVGAFCKTVGKDSSTISEADLG
ncbi:hypothetical protein H7J77_05670 [Mycolicibacillus parakoreensis]|uniref:DUF732 domain-containing protein n=1 Tax=Mycolicibacillus parakoreensis TaxID=1069221 RepID=A0ABY3U4F2_9MYCO|nr:hypothetical protein [Mycolicibacillus parakoreensis]MCV7315025.1 hypothetical protein [Mycolicibacillus parakoreensis]ULN53616.1 hypothetical protein MIU77_04615 [Mycolicibacillus parakoreensis]HLR99835.1 hypothetical protein [Mycolicibacillus parakoreensis]